jgi:uncharacterized protein (DUF1778 family)
VPTSAEDRTERETLIISVEPGERNLIDRAANISGKNRTAFILDAVRSAAEEALYSQMIIKVDPEAYEKFFERLVEKPSPNPRLLKTMTTSAPWEEE